MSYTKGSEWRKWDLHVHTPSSIVQNYWWDNDENWEKFITDLEKLPAEYKAIGINDYNFIDGYKKILNFKAQWRLSNIDLILPVIELRLTIFWWKDKFSSINFHVIFSDNVSSSDIQNKFINQLVVKVQWNETCFIQSKDDLQDYWKKLIEKWIVQNDGTSNLDIWFKNARFDINKIEELLTNHFSDNYLLAIWKNEWEDIRWDSAPVEKKDIINKSHFVFTASLTLDKAVIWIEKLKNQWVNHNLLHFSDAHNYSDDSSVNNNKIWKSYTWIKADPTFEWLKQIIYEPEDRVFIWEKPEVLDRVNSNKTKYIKSLQLNPIDWYTWNKWRWFENIKIDLNDELVTIIWNKGNGKSAIADIIWLLWNTYNDKHFSFLDKHRFCKNKLANNFEWTLTWKSWESVTKNLSEKINEDDIEKVRYLPQNFFNKLATDIDNENFKQTIENVVFQHLDDSLKIWKTSFEELKKYKTETIQKNIDQKKVELWRINSEIFENESKNQEDYKKKIINHINAKNYELEEQKKLLKELTDDPVVNPSEWQEWKETEFFTEIEGYNSQISDLSDQIEWIKEEKRVLEVEKEELNNILQNFTLLENYLISYKSENKEILQKFDLNIDEIVTLNIDKSKVNSNLIELDEKLIKNNNLIIDELSLLEISDEVKRNELQGNSLIIQKNILLKKVDDIKTKLSDQEKIYQKHIEDKKKINKKIIEITGNKDTYDSLEYYQNIKNYLETDIENVLGELRKNRLTLSLEIFQNNIEIIELYKWFKEPIDQIVTEYKDELDDYNINIDVKVDIDNKFNNHFLSYISQNKKWSFNWKSDWEEMLKSIYMNLDLNNQESIETMLNDFIDYLNIDKRLDETGDLQRYIFEQVSDIEGFYNYIFGLEFLELKYELKLWEKSLDELSPWEKGTLLLIFYLMIDREWIPLIIDQPEDNLDNQSVYKMLTKFIKIAKKKRQIIIITHNPNLAIWSDAEQIITVNIDKSNDNLFTFSSWSIENEEINKWVVNILEWTMPAFDKRRLKYK